LAVNKYLHTVAPRWISSTWNNDGFFNRELLDQGQIKIYSLTKESASEDEMLTKL